MNRPFQMAATLTAVAALLAACTGPGATTAPTTGPTEPPMSEAPSEAPMSEAPATPITGGLLDKVMTAGKIVISTDPAYPPQSEQKPDGSYEGFDIDVATELANRLGVDIEWATPPWEAITAGGWGGRWDISVGSMTITPERLEVVDFTVPYYFTPAQMAASTESGITTLEGMAGQTICAGEGTTYFHWLQGNLDFGPGGKPAPPPAGVTAVTLPTDRDCALAWQSGRFDFAGWVSAEPTIDEAIADGLPLVKVGDPVYSEPLAVAADKSGPDPSDLLAFLSDEITKMHADGTLSQLSIKWYGEDITKDPSL
ncbi:MAG: transporter substrate-binding domain-containing protein [Chloroflexi bacterium]|nr:transporter substrate-binding domain-containing protein [Chloroflexota bacterium]